MQAHSDRESRAYAHVRTGGDLRLRTLPYLQFCILWPSSQLLGSNDSCLAPLGDGAGSPFFGNRRRVERERSKRGAEETTLGTSAALCSRFVRESDNATCHVGWDTVPWQVGRGFGSLGKGSDKTLQPSLLSQAAEGVVPQGPGDAAAAAPCTRLGWRWPERVLFAIRPVGTAPPWCKPSDVNRLTCLCDPASGVKSGEDEFSPSGGAGMPLGG